MRKYRATSDRWRSTDPRTRRNFLRAGGTIFAAALLTPNLRARAAGTGFDFYISPSGSDSNPGTAASPWALTALNTKRQIYAGRRVGVMPGRYNCLALLSSYDKDGWAKPAFNIAGGKPNSPTIVQSIEPQRAVLDGGANGSTNPGGQPLIGSSQPFCGPGHIVLDGFEILGCYNRAVAMGAGASVPARNLGLVVQNCSVHGLSNEISGANPTAITIYAGDGALVQNNFVTDFSDTTDRACGIEFWGSINCVAQFNTIVGTNSQLQGGLYFKNAGQYNNTVRFNYIDLGAHGNSAVGIAVDSDGDGSTKITVNNNIVIADVAASPALIITGKYPASLNNQLWYNNTMVGIPAHSVGAFIRFGAAGTITFFNNIISRSTTGGRGDINTNISALALIDYNCYPRNPVLGLSPDGTNPYPSIKAGSAAEMNKTLAAATLGRDQHSIAADPQFVARGTDAAYFQLAATSPCKGKGSTTGAPSGDPTDMGAWGNGAKQIGCDFVHPVPFSATHRAG
jgi:hypothetical protein